MKPISSTFAAADDSGEVRSICESICSDGSSATVQGSATNVRPRMDIACVLDITNPVNLSHRKRALQELRLASELVNANFHHIHYEKLDTGETNVLETFYNADVALVDLSLLVQQSSLLYHLGVRESFDMKENVLLYNDIDADATLRLKISLPNFLFVSYKLTEAGSCVTTNPAATKFKEEEGEEEGTNPKQFLALRLKKILEDVELHTKRNKEGNRIDAQEKKNNKFLDMLCLYRRICKDEFVESQHAETKSPNKSIHCDRTRVRGARRRGRRESPRPTIEEDPSKDVVVRLQDLPHVKAIETPKTIRKRRLFTNPDSREPSTSEAVASPSAVSTSSSSSFAARAGVALPWDDLVIIPSPAAFVTCSPSASSAVGSPSTPQAPPRHPCRSARQLIPEAGPSGVPARRPATPEEVAGPSGLAPRASSPPRRPATPEVASPPAPALVAVPPPRRPATPPEQLAGSSAPRALLRPMRDADIEEALFGEDDDSEPDEDMGAAFVPFRRRQLYFGDDDDDVDDAAPVAAHLNMDWEPVRPIDDEPEVLEPTNSVPFGPEKFDFIWRRFGAVAQESPSDRRESFLIDGCGPTQSAATPYDAFTQIWDRPIVEHIVTETNKYAQQYGERMMREGTLKPSSRITRWKDTSIDEIYRLFAVLLAMGMVVKSRLSDYWSQEDSVLITPGFPRMMSINRFKLLIKFLHFSDSSIIHPSKLFRIQPILDHLNHKFQSLYIPNRNLALDESLTLYKGWLSIKQFINNKVAGVGIKTYEVCESATGYLYRFEVHAGTHQPADTGPLSSFVPALVLRLLDGLENKGYTVWMDNFYNSPVLAREMKLRGFDCVGTLRPNRQFVPIELANLNLTDMGPGEVRGCTSGDVDLVVWRDKKKVNLISTYHGLATVMDNRTRTLKPSIVPDYNVCMGGVDSKDQQLAAYPVERTRQRIWYKKLFRRLLNVSVLNSYIIYKYNTPISHRKFRELLINSLLQKHPPSLSRALPIPIPPVHQPPYCAPAKYRAGHRVRRVCKVCRSTRRVETYCKKCNIAVCIFNERCCWEQHLFDSANRP